VLHSATVLLPVPAPYDFHLSLTRFRDFGTDLATVWHEGGLHRVVAGTEVRIEPAAGGVHVEPPRGEVVPEVSRLFGLPFELEPFRAWSATDTILGPLVARLAGFRPTLNPRPFEALVVAITTQQISLRAAAAIRARFVERYGVRHEIAFSFPERDVVARLRPSDLLVVGFSTRKAEYLIELARSDLDLAVLEELDDDEVIATLTALPGLGRWTADWFLARHLARPRAWPAGDLGLRKAVSTFYAPDRLLTIQEVRTMGERFAPFENLSAQFLLTAARMHG
jgi:DNA-3-methyladenine glycosylase II